MTLLQIIPKCVLTLLSEALKFYFSRSYQDRDFFIRPRHCNFQVIVWLFALLLKSSKLLDIFFWDVRNAFKVLLMLIHWNTSQCINQRAETLEPAKKMRYKFRITRLCLSIQINVYCTLVANILFCCCYSFCITQLFRRFTQYNSVMVFSAI